MNWSGLGSRTSWRPRICSTLGGWSCCGTTRGGAGRDDCAAAGAAASATAAAQAAISFAGKAGENDRSILLLLDSVSTEGGRPCLPMSGTGRKRLGLGGAHSPAGAWRTPATVLGGDRLLGHRAVQKRAKGRTFLFGQVAEHLALDLVQRLVRARHRAPARLGDLDDVAAPVGGIARAPHVTGGLHLVQQQH